MMGKWKPWQFVFLAYLLVLNFVVFCVLSFFLLTSDRFSPKPTIDTVAQIAATLPIEVINTAQVAVQTISPTEVPVIIPSVNIPPVALPTPITPPTPSPLPVESEATTIAQVLATDIPAPTATPSATNTSTPTQTPIPTATLLPTPQPTATPTKTPKPTATYTPKPTFTKTPKPTASPTPTHTKTPRPTSTRTPKPTFTKTPKPTATVSSSPTLTKTSHPTSTLTPKPTATKTKTARPTRTPKSSAPQPRTTKTPVALAAANINYSDGFAVDNLLDTTALTNGSVALSWLPVAKSSRYKIYSDMGSGYGVYIYKAETEQTTFIDNQLRWSAVYNYRLAHLTSGKETGIAQGKAETFANTLQTNTNDQPRVSTASIIAAPTALPADAVLLGLVSDNGFTDDFNTLTLVGEVRNDSPLDVGQTDITVTFYDNAGTSIGTTTGQTLLDTLPPGEKSPFHITLTRPAGFASYSLRAVARPVPVKQSAQLAVVEQKRFEDETGFFHVKGVVENVGNTVSQRTKVAVVIYARDGTVINVGFTYVNPATLAPGEKAAYDVTFAYYPRYLNQQVIPFEE